MRTVLTVIGAAVLIAAAGGARAAAAQGIAGIVIEYQPAAATHTVQRAQDGVSELVGLGTPVHVGDRVVIGERGAVTIEFANGRRETYTGPQTVLVPAVPPLGVAGRIIQGLRSLVAQEYRSGTTAATRGTGECAGVADPPPVTAPVLRPVTRLLAGTRDLSLAWLGGCAPYAVRLERGGRSLVDAAGLGRPLLRTDTIVLEPGAYRLAITTSGPATGAAFDVIVADALPAAPDGLDADDSPLGHVARAAWLAELDDGAWRWEAFQLLRPLIREGHTLAGVLADLLMWGDPELAPSRAVPDRDAGPRGPAGGGPARGYSGSARQGGGGAPTVALTSTSKRAAL
jgi:hypothetical protein